MSPRHPADEPRWRRYLRFFRRSIAADIDDELRFHFDERIADLVAQGLPPDAARARATDEFGDVTEVRQNLKAIDRRLDERRERIEWLRGLAQDFAYSARSLLRTPVVSVTIVLTLALGIGVNVAMFSLIDVLYLRLPAGVTNPDGVHRVWIYMGFSNGAQYWPGFDHPTFRAITDALRGDAATATYRYPIRTALRGADDGSFAQVSYATAEYFPLLGVRAARGRVYAADEDRLGSPVLVAVVSDAFWRGQLGGADSVVGRHLRIGKAEYTIIGVTPPRFAGTEINATDVWVPLATLSRDGRPWWESTSVNGFQILVRPRAGILESPLTQRIDHVARGIGGAKKRDTTNSIALSSLVRARGPGKSEQEVQLAARLGGVALLVLVIAIANVVNLLLARALRRRREIAVRLALGISQARLLRLLVSESVLLASAAAIAAVVAAWWGGALLRSVVLPDVQWAESPLHWRVLAFAVVIALAAGVLAGLIPALQSSRPDLTDSLKAGSREGTSPQHSRLRSALVVVQASLSVILLVGSALFVESLANVRALDIGFDQDHLSFADVRFDASDTARDARVATEMVSLAERLRSRPGVESVALTGMQPMGGFSWETFYPEADTIAHKKEFVTFIGASPEYFETIGLRIVRGVGFPADGSASQLVVINQALADRLWPGENPIGRCIRFTLPANPCYRISGIAENARRDRVIEEEPAAQYYLPLNAMPFPGWRAGTLIVRSNPAARAALGAEIRKAMLAAFPGGRPTITQMTDYLAKQYRPWQMGATLFTLFGVLALIVAVIGIYSTISYAVGQRMHEFGVRIALGARTSDVLGQVLEGALRVVGIGVLAGVGVAILAGRFVASLLYGVEPADTRILLGVSLLLLVVAAAAALAPAWRAARVNPVTALRAD